MATSRPEGKLASAVGRSGYFTLAFGAVVGSGWVVVLGEWLRTAGPVGAAVGFLTGAIVMALIALCYGELAARSSTAGGEFLYTLQTFGPRAGFVVAWFLTLYAIASCAFEAIACAWLIRTLLPAVTLGEAYGVAGIGVGRDALLIGAFGAAVIGLLHRRGARSAIAFQNAVTYGFIGVSLLLMACGFMRGSLVNLRPLLATGSGQPWSSGALWIFSTCAFFLNGWQAALHAIEERQANVSVRSVVHGIVGAILAAAAFHIAMIAAAASSVPWRSLIGQELATSTAFRSLGLNGSLGTVVLVAAAVSVTKTWSAMTWVASRLIYAQARQGLLPEGLARVDPRSGAPSAALAVVVILTMLGVALGRAAVVPIVNMVSLCLALSMLLCLLVLARRRAKDGRSPEFAVPGGWVTIVLAAVGALTMVGIAVVQPILLRKGLPPEWFLLFAWAALGLVVLAAAPRLRHRSRGNAGREPAR